MGARPLQIALTFLLAAVATLSLVALGSEFSDHGSTVEQLLPRAEVARLERASGTLGEQGEILLVALDGAGSPWSDTRVNALREVLEGIPGVARAQEPPALRRIAAQADLRILCAWLERDSLLLEQARRVSGALDTALAAARREGERAYAIGRPRMRVDSWALARTDLLRLMPVLALAALVIPWVFLGTFWAGLFALLVTACTTSIALWGHRLLHGPLSPLALTIVPLLWAIATLDAMHLAGRARAFARRGLSPADSIRRARAELLAPCLVTSVTTAAGLSVVALVGNAELVRQLALVSAVGVMAAHALTFGPCAALLVLDRGALAPPRWPAALGLRAIRLARSAPRSWIIAWAGLGLVALAGVPRVHVSTTFPRLFAEDVPLARDLEHLAAALGTDLNPVQVGVLASDAAGKRPAALVSAVLALTHDLRTIPEVRFVLPTDALEESLLEPGTAAPLHPDERQAALEQLLAREELQPWIDLESGRALVQVHLAPMDQDRKRAFFRRIEHLDASMLGHHELLLAGSGYASFRAEELGLIDLRLSMLLSLLALAGILWIALRRTRTWAVAMVASTLPLVFVAGAMGLASIPWSIALLPLPAVLLGIAVDDSVHLLWRPRGRERFGALPAILATTAVLVVCVSTLAWTSFETNRAFGMLLGLGLVVALLADLTLLPALVRVSRRR